MKTVSGELQSLLNDWANESISDERFALLEQLIACDPDARRRFLDWQNLLGNLETIAASEGTEVGQDMVPGTGPIQLGAARSSRTKQVAIVLLSLAVVVLLAVNLLLLNSSSNEGAGKLTANRDDPGPNESGVEALPIATVADGIEFKLLGPGNKTISRYHSISTGDHQLQSGDVCLRFRNGVELTLSAPAEFHVYSVMKVGIGLGRARVFAPEAGHGFQLATPDLRIEDLGTEFAVLVEPRRSTQLHVFEGKVRVHRPQQEPEHLVGGEAALWKGERFDIEESISDLFSSRTEIGFRRYTTFAEELRRDPSTVFYYDFESSHQPDDLIVDRAVNSRRRVTGKNRGGHRVSGRWAENRGLLFDQDDAAIYLDIPGRYDAFTFSAWVKLQRIDHALQALLNTRMWNPGQYHLQIDRGRRIHAGIAKVMLTRSPDHAVQVGKWIHLASVVDLRAGSQEFYIDGERVKRHVQDLSQRLRRVEEKPLRFGRSTIGAWAPLSQSDVTREICGRIDELALFDRAFTEDEIHRIYDAGNGF